MTYYIAHSGIKIDLTNMSIYDINLDDIAHHLTKICRYGGALDLHVHYSVANHCIALFYYALENGLSIDVQRNVLMHDASETYLGDVVSGLKNLLPCYKEIELLVEELIKTKYNLSNEPDIELIVKELDTRILLDESKAFVPTHYKLFKEQLTNYEPLGIKLYPEKHLSVTKAMFLHCCEQLNIKD